MRRTTILLTAACLALAGCSSSGEAEPDAKTSTAPTVDPGDAFITAATDAHLDSWADNVPLVPPADELKAFPPKWCEALEEGHSVQWMLDGPELYPVGETWGTEKTDAYQLVLLGVKTHCPKWEGQVREELRESGEY